MKLNIPAARLFAAVLCTTALCASCTTGPARLTYSKKAAVRDTGSRPYTAEPAESLVARLGVGWNLGNTLDAHASRGLGSEQSWGQPHTTQEMFHALAAGGIQTVRIPVTWHNHLIDDKYTVDPEWMARVKTIVDWALAENMYVILNTHHDNAEQASFRAGQGYYPAPDAAEESVRFLTNVWAQIALAFNGGYDEHLIFELLNEPRLIGSPSEWNFSMNDGDCLAAARLIREYEQAALDVIRASGGNNRERLVLVPAYGASPDAATADAFAFPKDSAEGRLVLSVHAYSPYDFAMQAPGTAAFTGVHRSQLNALFQSLEQRFCYAGIPVVIGETGAVNKDNLAAREQWAAYFWGKAAECGMAACIWDNGVWHLAEGESAEEHFGYFNRTEGTWYFPSIIQAAVQAAHAE